MSVFNSIDLHFSPSESVGIHFRWQKSPSNPSVGVFVVDGFTDDSPAQRMGTVKKGCKLVRLNGIDLKERGQNVVVRMMKGCMKEKRVLTFLEERVLPKPERKVTKKNDDRSLASGDPARSRRSTSRSLSPSSDEGDISTPARRRRIVYEFVKSGKRASERVWIPKFVSPDVVILTYYAFTVYGNYIAEATKLATVSIIRIRAATKIQALVRSKQAKLRFLLLRLRIYNKNATKIQSLVRVRRAKKKVSSPRFWVKSSPES